MIFVKKFVGFRSLPIVAVVATMTILCGCCHSGPKNVVLTGYWPPSNQMLSEFSTDKQLNPAGWQGKNWRIQWLPPSQLPRSQNTFLPASTRI